MRGNFQLAQAKTAPTQRIHGSMNISSYDTRLEDQICVPNGVARCLQELAHDAKYCVHIRDIV